MSKRMLIDAGHPEETRVVIVDGTKVEELDFESANKKQLRGNLYLARVTRVEPSLQAAFIEYGGNRHGFLAFSEIHPDYYQIPFEDRMALLEAEEAEALEEAAEDEAEGDAKEDTKKPKAKRSSRSKKKTTSKAKDDDDDKDDESADEESEESESKDDADEEDGSDGEEDEVANEQEKTAKKRKTRSYRHRYKIQEVIKRGQILLIQVVKEERGNKGAAMTTYLSLAGRYCVLMPNTPKGGGISRKIANGSDRKRLKSIVSEFEVPQGMGVIVRTAGAKRTKTEVKRDYDYLCRLWETIRDTTLSSIAPTLIHEEGDLVKRSIRDLYNKDIQEVLVQGDNAYKTAKGFIKMLMPSHSKYVKAYKDDIPLFLRYQVESQIEDSLDSVVQLKSGGYLVIHPTEALVSIDVNSGRSTKERNVERTALKTNLEAADEVARQMRLRDLAGLIVIDFIDMDEYRNNRSVEKRMRDALSQDRARVQAGRISQFGLMEISRQRRRRSLLEGSTVSCPHCEGVGRKRTVESSALKALRAIEETAARGQTAKARLTTAPEIAAFILNDKRKELNRISEKFEMYVVVEADPELYAPNFVITEEAKTKGKNKDPLAEIEKELKKAKEEEQKKKSKDRKSKDKKSDGQKSKDEPAEDEENDGEEQKSKRSRRRGRRGGRKRKSSQTTSDTESAEALEAKDSSKNSSESSDETDTKEEPKKRTRSRRSRSSKSKTKTAETVTDKQEDTPKPDDDAEAKPKKRSRTRRKAPAKKVEDKAEKTEVIEAKSDAAEKPVKKATRSTTRRKAPSRAKTVEDTSESKAESKPKTDAKSKPKPKTTTKPATKVEEKPAAAPKKKPATRRKTKAKTETKAKDTTDAPKKRGWWQRKT